MKSFFREWATALTALVFVVIGTTGSLLFFHLFESRVKELHEILGLVFVAAALAHVYFNWSSMKRYFPKKVFLVSLAIVAVVSAGFILSAKSGPNPKALVLDRVLNAPLPHAMAVLGLSPMQYGKSLKAAGLKPGGSTIAEIARNNNVSPFEVIAALNK